MLDLRTLFQDYQIAPKGVIHIGANEGQEVHAYLELGFHRILFIEANPIVFDRLQAAVAAFPQVIAKHCAISDRNGMETLFVTNADQSSSILPLLRHRHIYPHIWEEQQLTVPSRTLDTFMMENNEPASHYNFMTIDIQGAELLALSGAIETLKHVEAIDAEVNFDEMYAGCALIHELDAFLASQGFRRVATSTPYHPSWGDALYVKRS